MKMNRYAAFVLTFLYLQSLYFVTGASLPVKNLVNTAGHIVEDRNPRLRGGGGPNDDNFPRPTLANCLRTGLTNRSDQVFGIYARISAWGHEHIGSDSYSAAVIQVSKDQGSEFKALRAGLHTFPALYNDTKVHMFAQWTRDRDWKTGCYDTDCPGFVPFKTIFDGLPQPGMVVDELSSYNQTDKSIILQIVKDERKGIGGDWWLYRVSGPARFPLGFWPATLFGSGVGTAQHATEAAWYGAVGFGARGIEPAMGNRHGPSVTGHARAAYFADISLMGRDAQPVDPSPRGLLPMLNAKGCYEIAMDAAGNNTFFYGGRPVTPYCRFD